MRSPQKYETRKTVHWKKMRCIRDYHHNCIHNVGCILPVKNEKGQANVCNLHVNALYKTNSHAINTSGNTLL